MTYRLSYPLLGVSALAFAFVGCNAILDNNPGDLVVAEESGTPPTTALPAPLEVPTPTVDAGGDAYVPPTAACASGQLLCFGSCVSMTDPLYGCGSPSCAACPATRGTMGCQGRACIVTACDPGYADCNAKSTDGCEVDLSKAGTCGACNAACAAAAPLCAPAGPSFQCTNGCTPIAPVACGAECVDPNTSPNDCGGCNNKCPAVANATADCNGGVCAFTCKPQFHACAGKCNVRTDPATCGPACTLCLAPTGGTATCVNDTCGMKCSPPSKLCGTRCVGVGILDNDPLACGAACAVCPVPANGLATCRLGLCGLACNAGFGNCDAMTANGCEAVFVSDPLNCGVCGKSCAGQPCVNGVCAVAPPPP